MATLFVAIDAMTTILKFDVTMGTVMAYYAYSLPAIMYQMMPVACLIATVFTLSGMNRANELTALFSMGTSLARISAPILVIVVSMSVLSLTVGDWLLPALNQKKNYVYYVDIQKKPGLYSTVKTNKIWYRAKNIILNIKTLNAESASAQGLTLYYFNDVWDLVQTVSAENLKIEGRKWKLASGTVTLFAEESSFPLTQAFKTKEVQMEPDTFDLQQSANSTEVMTMSQLKSFIIKNKDAGFDTLQYEVDYQSKISFAFAGFVMTLIGIPFCARHMRQGGMATNVGIVILLVFVYWSMYSSALTIGKHGTIPPILAAWAPNIIMVAASIFLLIRQKK